MVNLTLMRVQLAGLEQILIQVAFILTKIASMAQTIDTDWFQLWFFITGDEIIIFKQLVSKCCAFICYEFFIVTTSALYRDSMIAEIIKIYEKHETLLRIFLGRVSCLCGPCALISHCFVVSAVHCYDGLFRITPTSVGKRIGYSKEGTCPTSVGKESAMQIAMATLFGSPPRLWGKADVLANRNFSSRQGNYIC